ncbi:MAG: bifunctional riboflavin kinase/FAD synthetase [bacterium]|nr:bifunctional riboflavin kinase/FAD synthetase [bacterium]
MIIHRDRLAQDVLQGKRSAVTVGSLDGLHVGHQVILNRLKELAAQHGEAPIVVTFDPHPRSLVDGGIRPISLLQSSAEKHDTLRTLGVEHLLVLSFDETIRRLSAREFIEQYVLRAWQANRIVAGYNHSFGKDRSGDRESLITMGRELNFGVEILPPVSVDGQTVSSTTIRRMLMEGELPSANAMLGRPYTLSGRVVRGFGRGRRMGCPTANLEEFASGKLIPRDGIYAAFAIVDGTDYPAAVSIGFNPTFGGQRHSVEAHILDFDRDLYGAVLTLKFVKRLRGEIKFSGEAALSDQMRQDLADIRDILRAEGYGDGPRPSQQQQAFRQQQ